MTPETPDTPDLPRVDKLPEPGADPKTIDTTVVGMHNLLSQFPGATSVQIVGTLLIDGEEYSVV